MAGFRSFTNLGQVSLPTKVSLGVYDEELNRPGILANLWAFIGRGKSYILDRQGNHEWFAVLAGQHGVGFFITDE